MIYPHSKKLHLQLPCPFKSTFGFFFFVFWKQWPVSYTFLHVDLVMCLWRYLYTLQLKRKQIFTCMFKLQFWGRQSFEYHTFSCKKATKAWVKNLKPTVLDMVEACLQINGNFCCCRKELLCDIFHNCNIFINNYNNAILFNFTWEYCKKNIYIPTNTNLCALISYFIFSHLKNKTYLGDRTDFNY